MITVRLTMNVRSNLKFNLKYDLPLVRSLHGRTISLGLLISHNVSLSSIETINAAFSALLEINFFDWLSKAQYRYLLEHEEDKASALIITDIEKLKRLLARLFEARHILVHEFPEKRPFVPTEVDEMLEAAQLFIVAADEGFTQLLHGLYPISQTAMNRAAREETEAAELELEKVVAEIAKKTESETIFKVQEAWVAFAKSEAERNAEDFIGGTIYPLYYHTTLKRLVDDRDGQLRLWLEQRLAEESDLG